MYTIGIVLCNGCECYERQGWGRRVNFDENWPIASSKCSGFDDRVQLLHMEYICVIYLQWLVPPQNNTLKINCLGLDNFSYNPLSLRYIACLLSVRASECVNFNVFGMVFALGQIA
jgi:hypothetical protein